MKLFKKNENSQSKATQKLPMGRKARKAFAVYAAQKLTPRNLVVGGIVAAPSRAFPVGVRVYREPARPLPVYHG